MNTETEIKKYGIVYDLLSDLRESDLKQVIENKLEKKGYKIVVSRNKYKFKYVGKVLKWLIK